MTIKLETCMIYDINNNHSAYYIVLRNDPDEWLTTAGHE